MRPSVQTTAALVSAAIAGAALLPSAGADAAQPPIRENLAVRIGHDVNATKKANICVIASADTCQPGGPGTFPGTFEFPHGIAANSLGEGPHAGDVYVVDNTPRVQELAPSGQFISAFGAHVDQTTNGDICTAASKEACGPGSESALPGEFAHPESVAVDPVTGDVYVTDLQSTGTAGGLRVQKFTPDGHFLLEIGKEVNAATKTNLCTAQEAEEGGTCAGPTEYGTANPEPATLGTEPGAFPARAANAASLAVGGPEDLLYVGDANRVQEFEGNGKFVREVSLLAISAERASQVVTLTVDPNGIVYVVYEVNGDHSAIRRFEASGGELSPLKPAAREANATISIDGVAADSAGRLAVSETEAPRDVFAERTIRAALYDSLTGRRITEFPDADGALSFGAAGALYAAAAPTAGSRDGHEVLAYEPLPVAELTTGSFSCLAGSEQESDVTLDCTLSGETNPEEVSETEAFFQWGRSLSLGETTPKQNVSAPGTLHASLTGLRPNETFFYRLAAFDRNNEPPEGPLAGETLPFKTPQVPPQVIGEPSAAFVKPFSAVLFATVNPENASTQYSFQYGPCEVIEGCPQLASTSTQSSAAYGLVATSAEPRNLQPGTTYHYRLLATNAQQQSSTGIEGSFTTPLARTPEPLTGGVSAITSTSATISGSVNPGPQAVTFAFQLAIDAGPETRFGVVSSGQLAPGATPVPETLTLSGLQPGISYAYRIVARSGNGQETVGMTATFTTAGLPSTLVLPAVASLLTIPQIAFPTAPPAGGNGASTNHKCKRGLRRNKHGKCVKSAKKRHASKRRHH